MVGTRSTASDFFCVGTGGRGGTCHYRVHGKPPFHFETHWTHEPLVAAASPLAADEGCAQRTACLHQIQVHGKSLWLVCKRVSLCVQICLSHCIRD